MFNLERLALVALATGLVVVACAAPTDPASEEDEDATAEPAASSDEAALAADDDADEDEDVGSTSSALTREEAQRYAADMREDSRMIAPEHRTRYCNRKDAFHCHHRHRGWHWESIQYGHSIGGWHKGRLCCVRVGMHHPHW